MDNILVVTRRQRVQCLSAIRGESHFRLIELLRTLEDLIPGLV